MPGDSKASIADTNVPDNEIASSVNQTEARNLALIWR